jgi:probable biosynthetic protein (TIGR04098 family)
VTDTAHRVLRAGTPAPVPPPPIDDASLALIRPQVEVSPSAVRRRVVMKPAMCGSSSLFVGQVGDWTWETVSALCGVNAFTASNEGGAPTYLSFYYLRVLGDVELHPGRLTFGDELDVVSSAYGFGSESVLTLHRLSPVAAGLAGEAFEPEELYERPRAGCIYVESFNRWITRSRPDSNEELVRSSPVGFRHAHLPTLDERHSPRRAYGLARAHRSFHDGGPPEWIPGDVVHEVTRPVDITRDVNGVGLLYFASYFAIADAGLLDWWRRLGRSDRSFLDRVVLDQRMCYLGNAQLDTVLRLEVRSRHKADDPREELVDVVVADRDTGRLLAVCTTHLVSKERHDSAA